MFAALRTVDREQLRRDLFQALHAQLVNAFWPRCVAAEIDVREAVETAAVIAHLAHLTPMWNLRGYLAADKSSRKETRKC